MIPEAGKCYYINYTDDTGGGEFGYIGQGTFTGKISEETGEVLYLFDGLRAKFGCTTTAYFSSSDIISLISEDYSI
jgi:hypothetical protein